MRIVTRLFAVIGFLTVIGCIIGAVIAAHFRQTETPLPDDSVLSLTIDGELEEKPGFDPFKLNHQLSLGEATKAIRSAEKDKNIKAIFLQIMDNLPLTQAQELHAAIDDYRRSGKPIYAFADTFGEQDTGSAEYYLATACTKIWLQPMGTVGLMGIASDQPFFKDALARIGIQFQASKREQYKTAFDNFTENGLTPANREMTESLLKDMIQQIVDGVAAGRKLDPSVIRQAMDTGPVSADDAQKLGLIDEIDFRDQALDELQDQVSSDDVISVKRYLNSLSAKTTDDKIALIYIDGELMRHSESDPLDPLSGEQNNDPHDVLGAFKQASDDDDIKAIIFRINSPGGSVVASETIRSGVLMAKDAGKPVIVSMGEMAGSGGYWIAADADRIIAEPATLTGSIGVLGGKPVVQKLLQDHGVTTDTVEIGRNSNMDSPFKPFTPEQQAKQDAMLDDIYSGFKQIVAEGRKLSPERVEEIAKGRVYTGKQAKEIGLVDELGGMETALLRAKEAAGLSTTSAVEVVEIPHEPSPAEFIRSLLLQDDNDDDADDSLMRGHLRLALGQRFRMLSELRPYLRALLQTPGEQSVLMAPMQSVQ